MEDQIQQLLDNPDSQHDHKSVTKLGILCGQLAFSQMPKNEPVSPKDWFPLEGDWDALQSLLGTEDGSNRFNDHEDAVMAFVDAYQEGIRKRRDGGGEL